MQWCCCCVGVSERMRLNFAMLSNTKKIILGQHKFPPPALSSPQFSTSLPPSTFSPSPPTLYLPLPPSTTTPPPLNAYLVKSCFSWFACGLLGACHGDVLSRVERAWKWKQADGDGFGRFVAGVVFSTATCHLFSFICSLVWLCWIMEGHLAM
jgi:hypothetical protein